MVTCWPCDKINVFSYFRICMGFVRMQMEILITSQFFEGSMRLRMRKELSETTKNESFLLK